MSSLKDVRNAVDYRSEVSVAWAVVAGSFVGLLAIAWVVGSVNREQPSPRLAVSSPWIQSHAVIAVPWVQKSLTSHDSLAICGDGNLYGLSPANGDTLSEYSKGRVRAVRSFFADYAYEPPAYVTGLACSQDGTFYALDVDDGTVLRIPAHGPANYFWSASAYNAEALAARPDGSVLLAVNTGGGVAVDNGEILRVSQGGNVVEPWAFADPYPTDIAIAADETVYVSYWNSPVITHISSDAVVRRDWVTLSTRLPAGTPHKLRPQGLCAPRRSITSYMEALDPQGDLYVAGGTATSLMPTRLVEAGCLWRITPKGAITQWVLSTPSGKPVPLWSLAVGNDGTLYGASTSPSIVKLTVPKG